MSRPSLDHLQANKFNSLAQYRHLAARLRQKVGPELAGVALEAVIRRDELTPDARLEVFCDFGKYFKILVPYPADVTDQIPDEQYVRNVVELLFKRTPQTASTRHAESVDGVVARATNHD
jgi:hypothetical protein